MKSLLSMQAIRIIRLFFLLLITVAFCFSCKKNDSSNGIPARYPYSGEQREKGFWIRLVIYEDEDLPAEVYTYISYDKDGFYRNADSETLSCNKTEDGFTLSDIKTGEVRYTAVGMEGDAPFFWKMKLSWNHSAGPVWEEYAEERGWESEMVITREAEPDIVYY